MHRSSIVALLVLICSAAATHAQHAGSSAGSSWTAPRTPWGDPDLQGNYTNKYETSTPFERPKEFEGRRMEDITAHELAAAVARRQDDTLARAGELGGSTLVSGMARGSSAGPSAAWFRAAATPWRMRRRPNGSRSVCMAR